MRTASLKRRVLLSALVGSDEVFARLHELLPQIELDPKRVMRHVMFSATSFIASAALVGALLLAFGADVVPAQGVPFVTLWVASLLVVMFVAALSLALNTVQALLLQHITLTEAVVEVDEMFDENLELVEDLRDAREFFIDLMTTANVDVDQYQSVLSRHERAARRLRGDGVLS